MDALQERNKYLHDAIKTFIEIESAIINHRYEEAYYLLTRIRIKGIDEFLYEMKSLVKEKLFLLYGEKNG